MKRMLLMSILFLFGVQGLSANYAFYKKVKNTCAAYRIKVNDSDMSLTDDSFSLTLNSMRNNFEMVMIIGFVSAGKAIVHQRYLATQISGYKSVIPRTINVMVNVPSGRGKAVISAGADAALVEQLANGKIEPSEFMLKIKDSIQTL